MHEYLPVLVKLLVYLTVQPERFAGIASPRMGIKSNLTWAFYRSSGRATCSELGWKCTSRPLLATARSNQPHTLLLHNISEIWAFNADLRIVRLYLIIMRPGSETTKEDTTGN